MATTTATVSAATASRPPATTTAITSGIRPAPFTAIARIDTRTRRTVTVPTGVLRIRITEGTLGGTACGLVFEAEGWPGRSQGEDASPACFLCNWCKRSRDDFSP